VLGYCIEDMMICMDLFNAEAIGAEYVPDRLELKVIDMRAITWDNDASINFTGG
jgi:hypothetical protein